MRYAKPVIKDKFWIVKDDNVNIATIEKRNTDYVIIKDSVKEQMSSETEVATFFGEDIFANQPKEVKLIKEAHDIEGYPTKVCHTTLSGMTEFQHLQRHQIQTIDIVLAIMELGLKEESSSLITLNWQH